MNDPQQSKRSVSHTKHHLVEYANGPSLEEINGTIEVPKNMNFGEPCSPILDQELLLPSAIWTPATGRLQLLAARIFNTY